MTTRSAGTGPRSWGTTVSCPGSTATGWRPVSNSTPRRSSRAATSLDASAEHAREAEERWGDTDAYRESARRTSRYTKADWQRITTEARDIEARLAAALLAGIAADSVTAMDLSEEHRQHIAGAYYDCPPRMHRSLADMYVEDPRFTAHYEAVAPGLAAYVRDAVHANADR